MSDNHLSPYLWRERALISAYGLPANRLRLRQLYIQKLVAKHSEVLIRAILLELAREPDFIPARQLQTQNIHTAPLIELLHYAELVCFYFKKIEETTTTVVVYVWHGIDMAALGECFVFARTEAGLMQTKRYQYAVS